MVAAKEKKEPSDKKKAEKQLKEFLKSNPGSSLDTVEVAGEQRVFVFEPWLDSSVAFILPDGDQNFIDALNSVFLPPRYSALYHRADRALEVIWTAYKLDDDQAAVSSREFDFHFEGLSRKCGFGQASETLLTIAQGLAVRKISETEFRNLRSFSAYGRKRPDEEEGLGAFGDPVSFWIRDLDWDEDAVLRLIRHINFYLRYYDSQSPVIVIHPKKSEVEINPKTRYFEGFEFPDSINSANLDQNLLVLWGASFGPARSANFLNYYRIIEYVSYYYMHEDAFQSIRDIIKKPHISSDLDRTSRDILLVLRSIKHQREQDAITSLLKETISPALIWREIDQNRKFFTAPTNFEGDLTIEPLITEKQTQDGFGKAGVERFASSITKIRNALAHGRDTNSHKTILPTSYNFDLLQPWLHLIAVAAGEVVLYDTAH